MYPECQEWTPANIVQTNTQGTVCPICAAAGSQIHGTEHGASVHGLPDYVAIFPAGVKPCSMLTLFGPI